MKFYVGGLCMVKLRTTVNGVRSHAAAEREALKLWKQQGWSTAVVVETKSARKGKRK